MIPATIFPLVLTACKGFSEVMFAPIPTLTNGVTEGIVVVVNEVVVVEVLDAVVVVVDE